MAYMSQERKAELAPQIKAVLKKYNVKGSIAVRHYSTLVVNIKSGKIDFARNHAETIKDSSDFGRPNFPGMTVEQIMEKLSTHYQINEYHLESNYSGRALRFLKELKSAMMKGNHDNSDIQTDYFDVGWYIDINIGGFRKPYEVK